MHAEIENRVSHPWIKAPDTGKLMRMTKHPVKVYSLSTCSHCKAVKKLLARHNIEFDVVEVDRLDKGQRKDTIAEVKQHNERLSFPTTVIGDEVVIGYKADQMKNLLCDD
jgi:glutaredoxin